MYNEDNGSKIIVLIFSMILYLGAVFFIPFIIMKYWNWFVVPATNFNKISYWLAFGIGFTIDLFKGIKVTKTYKEINNDSEPVVYAFVEAIATWAIMLLMWGIGALIQLGI